MIFGVNTSPFAGREGQFVTSRQIKDRLDASCSATSRFASSRPTRPEQMKVIGRGELQLSILIEMMRREGYELQVSRPEIVTKRDRRQLMSSRSKSSSSTSPRSIQGVVIAEVGSAAAR